MHAASNSTPDALTGWMLKCFLPCRSMQSGRSLAFVAAALAVITLSYGTHTETFFYAPSQAFIGRSFSETLPSRKERMAFNILSNTYYPHHPVFQSIALNEYPLRREYITELNGLLVPAEFDCDIFNNGTAWGGSTYFTSNPGRWVPCWKTFAYIQSGFRNITPELPIIDEEYAEHVTVFQSVLRASEQQTFVMAELGARWGTWGSRAIGLWKTLNASKDYDLDFVELNPVHCDGLSRVMDVNKIRYQLQCSRSNATNLKKYLDTKARVDLIDTDTQGAEADTLIGAKESLNEKVVRLIIGTHSDEGHEKLLSTFSDWILIYQIPTVHSMPAGCWLNIMKNLRRNNGINPEYGWQEIIDWNCSHRTAFGSVANWDGEIVLDNPRFVDRNRAFSLHDDHLKLNDLITTL